MKLEEVRALSEKELDTLAAKLGGWERSKEPLYLHILGPGTLTGPYWWKDCNGNPGTLPDYSNDIAAAWELVKSMQDDGYLIFLTMSHRPNLNAVRVVQGIARSCPSKDLLEDQMCTNTEKAVVNIQGESITDLITRAHVFVRTQKEP